MIIPIIIPMKVTASREVIPMSIGVSYSAISAPEYEGEYEVTPRLFVQSLDTDGKLMRDDVTVYEIPITRTTNPSGGQTVLIG